MEEEKEEEDDDGGQMASGRNICRRRQVLQFQFKFLESTTTEEEKLSNEPAPNSVDGEHMWLMWMLVSVISIARDIGSLSKRVKWGIEGVGSELLKK